MLVSSRWTLVRSKLRATSSRSFCLWRSSHTKERADPPSHIASSGSMSAAKCARRRHLLARERQLQDLLHGTFAQLGRNKTPGRKHIPYRIDRKRIEACRKLDRRRVGPSESIDKD